MSTSYFSLICFTLAFQITFWNWLKYFVLTFTIDAVFTIPKQLCMHQNYSNFTAVELIVWQCVPKTSGRIIETNIGLLIRSTATYALDTVLCRLNGLALLVNNSCVLFSWWRHDMETLCPITTLCEGLSSQRASNVDLLVFPLLLVWWSFWINSWVAVIRYAMLVTWCHCNDPSEHSCRLKMLSRITASSSFELQLPFTDWWQEAKSCILIGWTQPLTVSVRPP